MPPSPQVHVGVSAWIERGADLLLMQRAGTGEYASDGHGQWALPGGWLEHRETEFETAVREVREETGLIVEAVESLGYGIGPSDNGKFTIVTIFVECRYVAGEPTIMEPDKCTGVLWTRLSKVRERALFASLDRYLTASGRL